LIPAATLFSASEQIYTDNIFNLVSKPHYCLGRAVKFFHQVLLKMLSAIQHELAEKAQELFSSGGVRIKFNGHSAFALILCSGLCNKSGSAGMADET
jgi:hypothetical protein